MQGCDENARVLNLSTVAGKGIIMPFNISAVKTLLIAVLSVVFILPGDVSAEEHKPSILFYSRALEFSEGTVVDAAYQKRLEDAGFNVTNITHEEPLSLEFLRQFGVVVVSGLPQVGEEFTVGGYKLRYVPDNLALLHEYVAEGGGLVVMFAANGMGEAFGQAYNNFLESFGGASLLVQQIKHFALDRDEYAEGTINIRSPLLKGMKESSFLYPTTVLRWDNAYSTVPILTDSTWQTLAEARKGATTHIALNNHDVGEPLSENRNIVVAKKAGKGYVAVSGIHAFYTLSHCSHKEKSIGEAATNPINWITMTGESGENGRPSAFADMLEHIYKAFDANSRANDIGVDKGVEPPEPEPYPDSPNVVDWENLTMPPSWQHRVIPGGSWPNRTYDELPDPLTPGPMNYWKVLVGPRTRYSNGRGSVAAWRKAAEAAGYSAIAFTEPLADIDKKNWDMFVEDCAANTDESFTCFPGLAITGVKGGEYLVLNARRYPEAAWLTDDGKRLAAIRMLSLGWYGHISVIARPSRTPLPVKALKQFQGIAVATYACDGRGNVRLVDDGRYAWQWNVHSDSFPIPIAVHELTSPEQVAQASTTGLQQIAPAPTLEMAMSYFPFGHHHAFDCPPRYFLSSGPILDEWTVFNKDWGKPEDNRLHFRIKIGVTSPDDVPIKEVRLYDHFRLVRSWKPNEVSFKAYFDGNHDVQHQFFVIAEDVTGRTVLSPGIRTVPYNYVARCTDRQNWLGTFGIYPGWTMNRVPGYSLRLEGVREGGTSFGSGVEGGSPAVMFEFPFSSMYMQIQDFLFTAKYDNTTQAEIAGDGKGPAPVHPNEVVDGFIRALSVRPHKSSDFAVMALNVRIDLKQDAVPDGGTLNPTLASSHYFGKNTQVILPDQKPVTYRVKNDRGQFVAAPEAELMELPVGSYAMGLVTLSPGLHIAPDGGFGLKPDTGNKLYIPRGTEFNAEYLWLVSSRIHWKTMRDIVSDVDAKAEQFLNEAGLRGKPPFQMKLSLGRIDKHAYFMDMTAENGGVAGKNINQQKAPMLAYVPLRIAGLNPNVQQILWRSDSELLEFFALLDGQGMMRFDADTTVDFYAGACILTDPRLMVELIAWDSSKARFRLHNPTSESISAKAETPQAVRGFKALSENVVVPAGQSVDIQAQ